MKLLALLLMATATAWAATLPEIDLTKFLACIAQKEHMQQDAIGPHGERSIYGITRAVWEQHRKHQAEWNFETCSSDVFWARQCAITHLQWLANELGKAGYPANAYTLGACWHHGLAGYLAMAKAGKTSEYGKDVLALYTHP